MKINLIDKSLTNYNNYNYDKNKKNPKFNGLLYNNKNSESTIKEILEIVAVSTIPVLIIITISNFFKPKTDNPEHIFLNDGSYFGHTDEFLKTNI